MNQESRSGEEPERKVAGSSAESVEEEEVSDKRDVGQKVEQKVQEGKPLVKKEEEERDEEDVRCERAMVPSAEVEGGREQGPERDGEDAAPLSEKERQNEELNEKDNCSASSISSASSTLEREEREEKPTSDTETGAGAASSSGGLWCGDEVNIAGSLQLRASHAFCDLSRI